MGAQKLEPDIINDKAMCGQWQDGLLMQGRQWKNREQWNCEKRLHWQPNIFGRTQSVIEPRSSH